MAERPGPVGTGWKKGVGLLRVPLTEKLSIAVSKLLFCLEWHFLSE